MLSAVLEIENVRQTLQGNALANPAISFSLRNDMAGECVLQTRRTNSVLSSFSMLFGSSKAGNMKEVNLKLGVLAVSGYISTDSHHNKLLQFVYINGRLVKKTPLHSCINNVIANSLIARGLSRQSVSSKWRSSNNEVDVGTPRRVSEKNGIYVLMLKCPRTDYDICLEPAKTLIEFKEWDTVLDFFVQVVKDFLIKHNLTLGPESAGGEETSPCDGTSEVESEAANVQSPTIFSDSMEETESCSIEEETVNQKEEIGCIEESSDDEQTNVIDHSTGTRKVESNAPVIHDSAPAILHLNRESSDGLQTNITDHSVDTHEVESNVPVIRESAPAVLHLNRPLRSPLNQRSISSKLANILQRQKHGGKSNTLQQSVCSRRSRHPQNLLLPHKRNSCLPVSGGIYSQSRLLCAGHDARTLSTTSSCSSVMQTTSAESVHSSDAAIPIGTVSVSSPEVMLACNDCPVPASSFAHSVPSLSRIPAVTNVSMAGESLPLSTVILPQISCATSKSSTISYSLNTIVSNQFSSHSNSAPDPSLSSAAIPQNAPFSTSQPPSPSSLSLTQNIPMQETHLPFSFSNSDSATNSQQLSVPMIPVKGSAPVFQVIQREGVTESATEQQQQQQGSCVPVTTKPDCLDCKANASASHSETAGGIVSEGTDGVYCIVERTETGLIIQSTEEGFQTSSNYRDCPSPVPDQNTDSTTTSCTIWKEKIDPRTAKAIYIHSKTGNCRTSKPDNYAEGSQDSLAVMDTTNQSGSIVQEELSTSYGARPITAAPHLSFDFEHFLPPSAKQLRLSDSAASHGILSLCSVSSGAGDDGDKESRRREEDCEDEEPSFHSLLRSWKNPAFLPGEEVSG